MPKLETPDGAALDEQDVQREFAKAMSAPEPDEPLAAAPPRADGAESAPEAREIRGEDKARTRPSTGGTGARRGRPKGSGKKSAETAAPAEGTFVQPVAEFLQSLTLVGALAPVPDGALKTRVRLQANLVAAHTEGLATAIDAAARHNTVIRKAVESLTMGASGWVLPAVLAVAPFAAQTAGLWRTGLTPEMTAAAERFEATVREQLQGAGAEDARSAA